ncbi:Uu.00g042260.m01.CDS01 [Anthostomella pinea]|uniref:Uu.00g042260.m01.CDS01 n=1 Tax=Anthostomella pinea TaxID=933095 RepID=A0AAI8VAN6_9PEZI|nr:Uu.00g042260.m01.CDS01 [Anthostomella pinea]
MVIDGFEARYDVPKCPSLALSYRQCQHDKRISPQSLREQEFMEYNFTKNKYGEDLLKPSARCCNPDVIMATATITSTSTNQTFALTADEIKAIGQALDKIFDGTDILDQRQDERKAISDQSAVA